MKKVLICGALFGLLGLGCGDETILGYQCLSGEKQQQIRYRTNSVNANHECESELQVRYCLDGSWERWSGSFQFDSCLSTCLFKDRALEAVVRETIGIPRGEIYAEDLVTTTRLSAPNRGIQDLAGLECWTSLEALDLSNRLDDEESPINQIVDIRPLEHHTKLEYLDLRRNQIDDIRSLVDNDGIGQGDEIKLSGNPIDCQDNEQDFLISKLMRSGVMLTSDCQ